jgi:hypothetical protein
MLAGLPQPLAVAFQDALSRAPFKAGADLVIELDLSTRLGEPIKVENETFIPLVVTEVLASRFNPTRAPNEPTDIPPHIFRLSKAFQLKTSDSDSDA